MSRSDALDAARQVGRKARHGLDLLFSRTLRPAIVRVRDSRDRRIGRRHGVDTFGRLVSAEHDVERGFYKPLPWGALSRILKKADVSANDVFLDVGAGKGRAVFLAAAQYPFKRVIGVELLEELSTVARANIVRVQDQLLCQDVRLVTSDALEYEIPDDVTIVFLYNPFRGQIFATVIQNLLESLERRPRRMRVVYFHPMEIEYLQSTGRFRVVRRVRGWRPTRQWARSYEGYLFDVLPSRNAAEQPSIP